jgi:hypothetical protein
MALVAQSGGVAAVGRLCVEGVGVESGIPRAAAGSRSLLGRRLGAPVAIVEIIGEGMRAGRGLGLVMAGASGNGPNQLHLLGSYPPSGSPTSGALGVGRGVMLTWAPLVAARPLFTKEENI